MDFEVWASSCPTESLQCLNPGPSTTGSFEALLDSRGGLDDREHGHTYIRKQGDGQLVELQDLTDGNFAALVLESDSPSLVDFWGDHCPACRQISPILRELAEEYAGRVRILKIHAAENPKTSIRFEIRVKVSRKLKPDTKMV